MSLNQASEFSKWFFAYSGTNEEIKYLAKNASIDPNWPLGDSITYDQLYGYLKFSGANQKALDGLLLAVSEFNAVAGRILKHRMIESNKPASWAMEEWW